MTISPNKWELDVQGYLNVCNITAATPRKQIRDFSAGVNDLGLWNSMVCWPLRSSQNYGSGDTVFSLGGLGTFNGTRVNGPTWEADGSGISGFLQNSSVRIETAASYNFNNANTVFACARKTASGDLRLVGEVNSTPLFAGSATIRYFNGSTSGGTAASAAVNSRATFSHAFGASNVEGILNGGTPVSSAYVPFNAAMQFYIGQGGSNGWVGDISFVALFNVAASTAQHSTLHTLYKDTLGQGLGLP